ncbi:MAG: GntR family transcriptional regulator [Gammaproteobacteria bacterium]|nr:GntR family transcriptional regulator [Gammaproteobacteria bacterium]
MKGLESIDFELRLVEKTTELKTHQWVYQLLRTNLLCGRIGPGIALTIRGLAQMLDVSPMPVREALHRLACEAAIEVKNNRRVIVPVMTAEKFNELSQLRIILETHAAVSALPHIDDQQLKLLILQDAQINSAVEKGAIEDIALSNQQFHRSLYSVNPAQRSVPLIESLWLQLGPFSRIVVSKLKKAYRIDHHIGAIEAIRNQNASALHKAIEADIRAGIASINSLQDIHQYFKGVA